MKKLLLVALCAVFPVFLGAQENMHTQLVRRINNMVYQNNKSIQVIMDWEKAVRVRDLLSRPARFNSGNTVVAVKTKKTYCRGYSAGEKKVYFAANCLRDTDFKLARVTVVLPNGQQFLPAKKDLRIDGNIAKITLP